VLLAVAPPPATIPSIELDPPLLPLVCPAAFVPPAPTVTEIAALLENIGV
jgi:hypothetical protein